MSLQEEKPNKRVSATSRSLTVVLVITFLALTLAALLTAYIPQLLFLIQLGNQAVGGEQQIIAQNAASTVSDFVQVKFDVLETAVKLSDLASTSQQDQEQVLANLLSLQPAFRQLTFLDAQQRELASLSRLAQTMLGNLAERAEGGWFAQVEQGNQYISPVYVDESTSEPLVIMAVPSLNVFGDFQGVLLAEVNLKFMWDLVGQLKIGEGGLAYVVDGQGKLIAIRDVSRVLRGESVAQLDLIADFVQGAVPAGGAVTRLFRGIDGTMVVGTCFALGVPNWAIVTELPALEGGRPIIQSTVISAVVIVGVSILAGLFAVYMARRLAAPMLDLTATASRIAAGEIDLQAVPQGSTEVVDLARAFNSMTTQLRETLAGLEQRVAERTQSLVTAAEVSAATTAVLDIDELLIQVVELMRERFALYYVGLFLVDEAREYAVLRAGSGQAGRQMMAQGWRLEVGGGSMIGRCVSSGQADIQLDVGEAAVRFDNPYLPATHSELALPLRAGGETLGAMTVQSDQAAFFAQEDISVLQTVADQVANAVRNARLFRQVQDSLEAERRASGELTRKEWQQLLAASPNLDFASSRTETQPADELWRPEMHDALRTGKAMSGDGGNTLALPIRVRDQVLGVIDGRKADGTVWTRRETDLLQAFTEQLSTALESSQLYESTQRRAAREQLVGEVTGRIRETLDMETMLRTAVDEIRQAMSLDRLVVRLGTPDETAS